METVIGIDLGTTYSAVSYLDKENNIRMIPNSEGEYITPSVVYFNKDKEAGLLVGKKAKEKLKTDPERVVAFVKREIGKAKDKVRYNKIEEEYAPYLFWDKIYSPEEISGFILAHLRKEAERELKNGINKAVITVPAYFGSKEKEATKQAGIMAGLEVLEIIPEPMAASLSYGLTTMEENEKIFVFDLGGGTFDVTILNVINQNGKDIKMIATDGNHRLGGKDWDDAIMTYVFEQFAEEHGIDLFFEKTPEAKNLKGKLRLDAENAKKILSSCTETEINIEYEGVSSEIKISRENFEELTEYLLDECHTYCDNVLSSVGLEWSNIDKVIMVGSMSHIPYIQKALSKWSGKEIDVGIVDPASCVAMGAAIKANLIIGNNKIAYTKNQISYDTDKKEELEKIKELEKTAPRGINIIKTANSIIPYSLGVIAKDREGKEVVAKIIPKHTEYPVEKSMNFRVNSDGQRSIIVRVVEGESINPDEVDSLGQLDLPLKENSLRGDAIKVTFIFDNSGILTVKAKDMKNDIELSTLIKREGALTQDEIEKGKEEINEFYL